MATPLPEARRAAYQSQITTLRATALALLLQRFMTGSYRDADMTRFVSLAAPIVSAARRQSASLTTAYLSQQIRAGGGMLGKPVPIDTDGLRGVPIADVYQRPNRTIWNELSNGAPLGDAVKVGQERLASLIETDVQLAKTNAAHAVLQQATSPRGNLLYQRTLKGPENCALCVVASTQVYSKADLMPIHPGCDCDVDLLLDIAAFRKTAEVRLQDAHAAVSDALGVSDSGARQPDYRKLVVVREHGEYGPTLTVAAHRFTDEQAALHSLDLSNLPHAS